MYHNNTIADVSGAIRRSFCHILGLDIDTDRVRMSYPAEGAPDWKFDETVLFLRFLEADGDDYGNQPDITYETIDGSVWKLTGRTRVWEVQLICYGPESHTWLHKIKDGVLHLSTKAILNKSKIYLVPDRRSVQRVPELYGGRWWERFDLTLKYNELYRHAEDVGHVEEVTIIPGLESHVKKEVTKLSPLDREFSINNGGLENATDVVTIRTSR